MIDLNSCYSFYFRNSQGRCVEKLFDSSEKLLKYIEKYHKTVCDIYHSDTGGNFEEYTVIAENSVGEKIRYGVINIPLGRSLF